MTRILAVCIAVLATFAAHAQEAPRAKAAHDYLERLEAFGFSGALLVMHKGNVVLAEGYGLADRARNVPITADTLFDVGSIVKTFTATAIQQYVDSGRISLDDTLPKFFADVPEDKRAITLRQLLTHTAGLPLYTGDDYELIPREKMIAMAFAEKLRFEPGSRWGYCNSCYSLLGAILEDLSGKPYELVIHERLLVPAGLKQTGYVIPNFLGRNVARGYEGDRDDGTPLEKAWYGDGPSWSLRGNGGFLSSVRELGQWARALDTTNITSAAARARASQPVAETGRRDEKMAIGWLVTETPQGRMVSHSGGNGIFGTNLRRYLDRDVVVVFSTNNFRQNFSAENDVLTLLFGGTVPLPPKPQGRVDVERLAGRYTLASGRELELRLEGGQLALDPFSFIELTRPAAVIEDERAKQLLATAKAGFEQIAAGTFELLTQQLVPTATAEEEREFWTGWMQRAQERRGKFLGATPLWVVEARDQRHAYVLMQFEKSGTIVRWEQRPAGMFAHANPPRQFPDLYRFIPQSDRELVTWNPHLGTAATLRIDGDEILLGGVRGKRK
ncbi:MAG TPA: serine hydrolase domain-containing protein [Thermoanaerobaculia bacterium]